MSMRVIVNADDFGFSEGTNDAIRTLASLGSISSTSIMVNMPLVEDICEIADCSRSLGIGLHVNLSQGRPLLPARDVTSLIDSSGHFHSARELAKRAVLGKVCMREVREEVSAQIRRARELVGPRLDHWDSHQGVHRFEPIATTIMDACVEHGVRGMRSHVHYFASAADPGTYRRAELRHLRRDGIRRVAKEAYYAWLSSRGAQRFAVPDGLLALLGGPTSELFRLVSQHPGGDEVLEIPCHPAVTTEGLWDTKMLATRVDEYKALSAPEFQEAIAEGAIRLVTFAELAEIKEEQGHGELAARTV